ncbi:MAG: radical SAM protein [Natronincolaceae bacterium]|jgi:wyosine [tRNA(Phe)-imidazoG37] synthetase (radical SAM superfamily)|nr:radical SAM protein [Bacillota bacterium]NLK90504.1 radical SAM protein [Clostridiales bacterium]
MTNFKYVYGTVPSRRMGLSVGVSPIAEGHCNYSCIYCQLGRTRNMTNKRKKYFDYKDIIGEFKEYISKNIKFDVATIVGEGEPLLYSDLGILIDELKLLTDKPIAVITNGALLYDSAVREDLRNADIVLPSLDATDEEMFKKINRPHGSIKFDDVVTGLRIFSNEYNGQLWIETMIVEGINDNRQFFLDLKELLGTINYHKLYINSPVRPPAETFVKQVSKEVIDEAVSILGGISIDKLVSEGFYSEIGDDYEAVLSIIKRHPMNQFEIKSFIEQREKSDIEDFFKRLNDDDNIEVVNYKNYCTYRLR